MPELICHLIGDYVLQNHEMATKKTGSWLWASIHVLVYMLSFLLIFRPSLAAIAVMSGTHLVIDRFRLAKYWVAFYGIGCEGFFQKRFRKGDEPKPTPDFLAIWLLIIVDNTFHLSINHAALTYL